MANHWIISGNSVSADGTVSFYGASMTKEQSEKLQSVIKDLEEQGHGTPNYRKGAQEIKESLVQRSSTGKTSVELKIEANRDITRCFQILM